MIFRELPSVHDLIESLKDATRALPHSLLAAEARRCLDFARDSIRSGTAPADLTRSLENALAEYQRPSLRPAINATGVILHTNLGRAPLTPFTHPGGYSNLEYNLSTGARGKRDTHTGKLLEAILGKPALTVNNGAAALFLILNELASGGEAVVSRGELIEIGDGFRIPDIMQRSGAALREAGTTNRTHINDYRDAINERTRVLLRVHPSNFRISGFTARPELSELVALGRERSIPVYEDLGSGCLVNLRQYGIDEPLAQQSLEAGANVVSFSGDKLLGGPQAGIIAGDAELVTRIRRNPLFRAVRCDKLFYEAMEPALRHILLEEYDEIPALRMIRMTAEEVRSRAEAVAVRIQRGSKIEAGESRVGGGATPEQALATYVLIPDLGNESAAAFERKLRLGNPPVIARIERDRVVIDLRTVLPEQETALIQAITRVQALSE